jgi:hypothetical protein
MKQFSKIFIITIFVALATSACLPPPASLDTTPPKGPPEYEKGWSEGCESGMNAYGTNTYKVLTNWKYKLDYSMIKNRMYYKAWNDAFLYCSMFIEKVNFNNAPTI